MPLAGVPEVAAGGQGGLLDVVIDPRFAENRWIYLSLRGAGIGGIAGTAVARGRLGDGRLEDVRVIYQQQPKVSGGNHFGSRVVFGARRHPVRHAGRPIRLSRQGAGPLDDARQDRADQPDGSVPRDNPFVGRAGARPEIWSYGHRNVQSAASIPRRGSSGRSSTARAAATS